MSITEKACSKCKIAKPLDEFHASNKSSDGKASWCKQCTNKCSRVYQKRNYSSDNKRKWQLKTRYGLTPECIEKMLEEQGGVCAICLLPPKRQCVDHSHETGLVRGLLCHRCNILIGGWDDPVWRESAMKYLGLVKQEAYGSGEPAFDAQARDNAAPCIRERNLDLFAGIYQ